MPAIVVVGDRDAATLRATVTSLVSAVERIEQEVGPVEVVLVAPRGDKAMDRLVNDVQGVTWVTCSTEDDLTRRWQLGRAAASQSVAWYWAASAGRVDGEVVLEACRSWRSEGHRPMPPALANPGLAGARVYSPRPGAITAGRHTYCAQGVVLQTWFGFDDIRIGSFCSIGDDVAVLHTGNGRRQGRRADGSVVPLPSIDGHRASAATTFPLRLLTRDADLLPDDTEVVGSALQIGHDVWIGYGAIVSGPVTVGNGAVIASGAVVLNDVPPYAVVAGNPARVVRMRFSAPVVAALQRIEWWNWPDELIVARWAELYGDIREFVRTYDPDPDQQS
jgi:acetyltransferase-like isoleucine patch superfamily enzyme